jgi:AcrR family transcriptional regulator
MIRASAKHPPAPLPLRGSGRERAVSAAASARGHWPTQRERLLQAVIELSVDAGAQELSVAQISAHAGVSTATFYECFAGKEDALLGGYRLAAARLLAGSEPALDDGHERQSARIGLTGLLERLRGDPAAGWMLCVRARCAGPLVLDELNRSTERLEAHIEALLARTPAEGGTLELPAVAILGALRSIISRHLRTRSEERLPSLGEDLLAWIDSYQAPAGRDLTSAIDSAQRALRPPPAFTPASAHLPRGRHGLSASVVSHIHRARLLSATAQVTLAKGYPDATVADIVAEAGVARDVFYRHFSSKQHVFIEAQRHGTQHLLEMCADAYFQAREWPERLCNALEVLLGAIAANPAQANLQLVDCYTAGPAALRGIEQTSRSFALFLREGYRYAPRPRLPAIYAHAIAGAVLEIIQRDVARGHASAVPGRLPQLAYLAIAPFAGAPRALALVAQLAPGGGC